MTTQPTLAIEATGLVKCFGDTRAATVRPRVSLGSAYGALGPNGAADHPSDVSRDPADAGGPGYSATTSSPADAVRGSSPDRPARLRGRDYRR